MVSLSLPRMSLSWPVLARGQQALAVARQRRDLAQLDSHLLADLGISEAEQRAEAARPFWDLPVRCQG